MDHERANTKVFPSLPAACALLLGMLIGGAEPASATQEYILPTLFDVTGVAADDVLNVRALPNASAEIIGTFAPNARNIEIVGHDETGQWGRINTGERTGWTALRYLAYQVDVWTPGTLPQTLNCLGTEPFWSFRPEGEDMVLLTPDKPEAVMRLEKVMSTGIPRDPRRSLSAQGASRRVTAVIVPMACSDGMSDCSFGLAVTLILEEGDAPQMLTGCCSIAPR